MRSRLQIYSIYGGPQLKTVLVVTYLPERSISGMNTVTRSDLLSHLHVDDLNNLSDLQVTNKFNDKFLDLLQPGADWQFSGSVRNKIRALVQVYKYILYKYMFKIMRKFYYNKWHGRQDLVVIKRSLI